MQLTMATYILDPSLTGAANEDITVKLRRGKLSLQIIEALPTSAWLYNQWKQAKLPPNVSLVHKPLASIAHLLWLDASVQKAWWILWYALQKPQWILSQATKSIKLRLLTHFVLTIKYSFIIVVWFLSDFVLYLLLLKLACRRGKTEDFWRVAGLSCLCHLAILVVCDAVFMGGN